MNLLTYDEEEKKLAVQFNTTTICEYSPISKETFIAISEADDKEKYLRKILRIQNVVGVRTNAKK